MSDESSIGDSSLLLPVRHGIFQGDSLSPLWFVLALNPLSRLLDGSGYGYKLGTESGQTPLVTHLLYMDDVKLYAGNDCHLELQLEVVKRFLNDIGMRFGIEKCRTQTIQRGRVVPTAAHLDEDTTIEALSDTDTYKYLGFAQAMGIRHKRDSPKGVCREAEGSLPKRTQQPKPL